MHIMQLRGSRTPSKSDETDNDDKEGRSSGSCILDQLNEPDRARSFPGGYCGDLKRIDFQVNWDLVVSVPLGPLHLDCYIEIPLLRALKNSVWDLKIMIVISGDVMTRSHCVNHITRFQIVVY